MIRSGFQSVTRLNVAEASRRFRATAFLRTVAVLPMLVAPVALCAGEAADRAIARLAPALEGKIVTRTIPPAGDGKDTIGISGDGGKIVFSGNTSLSQVAAFGYWMRHGANAQLAWNGDRLAPLAHPPVPEAPLTQVSPYAHRYAYNYCALGYTAPFWGWSKWEREIDFQASNGMNEMLVIAGVERVWQSTLRELGYPEEKIAAFIPTSAFAPWWHMGNLEGVGGPVPEGIIAREVALGQKIVGRLRELDMRPVLPGFVGLLPHDIGEYVPGLRLIPQGKWVRYYVRPVLLDPTTPEFSRIAAIWYKHLHAVFGGAPYGYSGDLFHEGGVTGGVNVTGAARAVQAAMLRVNPEGVWFIQGWGANPKPELLAGLDPKRTLVLALNQDFKNGSNPRAFGEFPWAFCEANNFGGKNCTDLGVSLFARLPSLLLKPAKPRIAASGVGLMSESLGLTPPHYDAFFDAIWRDRDTDTASWLDGYALRRYGSADADARRALGLYVAGVEHPSFNRAGAIESIICARPGWNVKRVSAWAPTTENLRVDFFADAAEACLAAAPRLAGEPLYRSDLVEYARLVATEYFRGALETTSKAYERKDLPAFNAGAETMLRILGDCDRLMATQRETLLGTWIADARAKGATDAEKALTERSARMLITTWCGRAPVNLNDYSYRQWSGLLNDYYLPRWQAFLGVHREILEGRRPASDATKWYRLTKTDKLEEDFATATKAYPTEPSGDAVAISRELIGAYGGKLRAWVKTREARAGLPWKLAPGEKSLAFDITDAIRASGEYRAVFRHAGARHALKIRGVAVYSGEVKLAEDVHEGSVDVGSGNNGYRLDLRGFKPVEINNTESERLILRADVEGAGGDDVRGTLRLEAVSSR